MVLLVRRAVVFLAVCFVLPATAFSAVITVGAGCTLTDAVTAANTDLATGGCPAGSGADEIWLTGNVTLDTVDNDADGANALPSIATEITVEGNGFEVARGTGPGTPEFRIFHVAGTGTLTLRDLIVANGYLDPVLLEQCGGGIFNASGTLVLDNSGVFGNTANSGGGIYQDSGTLILIRSTMAGNSARFSGGAIDQDQGTVTVTDSTLTGNSALTGAGLSNLHGEAIITNSTFSGNSADYGGGVRNYVGTVTLTNSTFWGNSADIAGGAIITFLANVILTNTIVANSPSGGNCDGGVVNAGNNLSDDTTCGTIPGSLTGLEAELLDNGGPTMTHALLAGSNGRDAGSALDCPPADQRGSARVGNCDIGAFEFVPCPDLVLSSEVVSGTEIRENCQAIVVGPGFSVAGSGNLTLRAGKKIELGDTTAVGPTAQLALEIEPDLQLALP